MKRNKISGIYRNAKVKGAKSRVLRKQKEKTGDVVDEPVLDKFIDEETSIDADDACVSQPGDWDIRDEVSHLESFRDWAQESRGNGLTYGDY